MIKKLLKSLFWLNLLIILYFWYSGSRDHLVEASFAGIFISLGRLTGLLAEFFILLQLILIARISWIERQFGHDELTALHRTIGTYILLLLIPHPIFLSVGYGALTESTYIEQFISFIQNWDEVLPALIGLIIFIVAVILSLTVFRKKLRYERWHFTHLFLYVAIFLALEHQTETGDMSFGLPMYYWLVVNYTVFGLMILHRFLRPFILFARHRFQVDRIEAESNDVWSVYIKGNKIDKFKFDAGQFAIINFLQKGMWTSHPFSISCAPNGKYIRFTIKSLGDFTSKINTIKPGTFVLIDGPLGKFTEHRSKTKRFLFIAGGVGITPIAGIIDSITKKGLRDIVLIYCVRSAAQIPFQKTLENTPIKTFYLISDGAHVNQGCFLSGRISKEKISELCPDFKERDIFFCGPPAMGPTVLGALKELGAKKERLHFEKFAF